MTMEENFWSSSHFDFARWWDDIYELWQSKTVRDNLTQGNGVRDSQEREADSTIHSVIPHWRLANSIWVEKRNQSWVQASWTRLHASRSGLQRYSCCWDKDGYWYRLPRWTVVQCGGFKGTSRWADPLVGMAGCDEGGRTGRPGANGKGAQGRYQ